MSLIEKLLTAHQGDEVVKQFTRIADAFERMAIVAERGLELTFPPAPVPPDKPMGPEAIGTYGVDMNEEQAEEMRDKLRAEGMKDHEIDESLVRAMFLSDDD